VADKKSVDGTSVFHRATVTRGRESQLQVGEFHPCGENSERLERFQGRPRIDDRHRVAALKKQRSAGIHHGDHTVMK
jgi:hypothetical protein